MLKTIIGDGAQPAGKPVTAEQPPAGQKETARRKPVLGRRRCISLGCYTGTRLAAGEGPGMSWPSLNRQDAALSRFCWGWLSWARTESTFPGSAGP